MDTQELRLDNYISNHFKLLLIIIIIRNIFYLKGLRGNNRSTTVLDLFKTAVNEFMLPSRVRGDKGGENVKVADFMIRYRGCNRGSYMTGASKFNTR